MEGRVIRRHPGHPKGLPASPKTPTEIACEESGASVAQSARKSVDDLLMAFSDAALASDEEEHSWESWNYSRLSFF